MNDPILTCLCTLLNPMGRAAWFIVIVFITIAALHLSVPSRAPRSDSPATYYSHRRLKLPSSLERRPVDNSHLQLYHLDPTDAFLTLWNLSQPHRDVFYRRRVTIAEQTVRVHKRICRENIAEQMLLMALIPCYRVSCSRISCNGYFGFDDMGRWKEKHFNASDADGDGRLNSTEFIDFLYPADSKNPNLLQSLCKEEVRERDTERDGKVSFEEFFHGLFDLVRNYDEESKNDSQHYEDSRDAPARALFAQLDKDGDGYLSHLELLPIIGKIHPSEHYYAKRQAIHTISEDDVDKDGRLPLTEVIRNPYLFYDSIFNNDEDEYGSDDESH